MSRFFIAACCIALLIPIQSIGQFKLNKIGVSSSIDRLITNYGIDGQSSKQEISFRTSIGGRVDFMLPGRFGLSTGLSLSHQSLDKSDHSGIHQQNHTSTRKALLKHQQTEIGLPIGLYMQTFMTNSCVTYLKVNANFKHRIYENERYEQETMLDNRFIRIDGSATNYLSSDFGYSGMDLDFSFGTFWRVDCIDAQILLEPRFRLYSYQKTNLSNVDNQTILYDDTHQVFSGMGLEIIVFKKIGKYSY